MKIGSFAKQFDVSIDTIRHYMTIGILAPIKEVGQFEFDEKCEKDMMFILDLKSLGFSLMDIKGLIFYRRFGDMAPSEFEYLRDHLKNKLTQIETEITDLKAKEENLKLRIEEIEKKVKPKSQFIGIPLHILSALRCHECENVLILNATQIENNQILQGSLTCTCGMNYIIHEGILLTNTMEGSIDESNNFDLDEYLGATPPEYLNELIISAGWLEKEFIKSQVSKQIILELGTGYGFIVRNICMGLESESVYICTDIHYFKLKYVKQALELLNISCSVVMIAGDFCKLPFKSNTVDVVIDVAGSSSLEYKNKEVLQQVNKYIKDHAGIFQMMPIYDRFGPNNYVPKEIRSEFTKEGALLKLKNTHFQVQKTYQSPCLIDGGDYECISRQGDKSYYLGIYAKR